MRSGSFNDGEQTGIWITYDTKGKAYKKTLIMRYKGGRDFTAIYKRRPVAIYEFKDALYSRWIITE
jgi:hypothetical protein